MHNKLSLKPGDLVANNIYRSKYFNTPGLVLEINEQTIHNIKYVFVSVFYSNCDIIHWNEKNLKIIKSANNY